MVSFLDVLFWALIPAFVMCLVAVAFSSKRKLKVMDSPLGLVIIALFEIPRFVMALLPQPMLGLPSLAAWIIGGAIFVLAMAFAGLGVYQIRMGALKLPNKGGKLQTSGIYGVVRHPIYFGDVFWPLGWSVMFNASYSLMLSPIWLIVLLLFSSVEEERLVKEYGDEYVKYKRRVRKRIIPGVI